MAIKPKDFNRLKLNTIETQIIKAMMAGRKKLIIDQSNGNIFRCHDEKLSEEKAVEKLKKNGFYVSRLYSVENGEKIYSGHVIKWGE